MCCLNITKPLPAPMLIYFLLKLTWTYSHSINLNLQLLACWPLVTPYGVIKFGQHLVQVIAFYLFDAKSLSEPMLTHCQLETWGQNSVTFKSNHSDFHSRKCIWKCRPFVQSWYSKAKVLSSCEQKNRHWNSLPVTLLSLVVDIIFNSLKTGHWLM